MSPRRYAEDTTVSTDKSLTEIRALVVRRYKADGFAHMEEAERAMILFRLNGREVKFVLALPAREQFARTPGKGIVRTPEAAAAAWEQACRSRWRALALLVKAKMEAVESGIVTFETEFLGHVVLPGNKQTVGEAMAEPLRLAYDAGNLKPLLPLLRGPDASS